MASPAPTPAELVAARPDIAAMQSQLPHNGPARPSAVDMQAAAQRTEQGTDQGTDGRMFMTYAGRRYYLRHEPDAFDLAELAEFMEGAEQSPIMALGGINRLLRAWLVPADYDNLRSAFRRELAGQDLDAQMTAYGEMAASLWEVTTARPTPAPDDSSDGRGPTSTSSKDASPSPDASPSTGPSSSTRSTPG